ncbi:MAG: S8 family serine peptidase, partial [Gemmatimonadetes bacterium]|nr:S8 family serine peptidase [Gemmatimonadota bacterium]
MRFRPLAATAFLAALAACGDQAESPVASAPSAVRSSGHGAIEGSYVVVLKEGADPRSVAAIAQVSPRYVYTAALTGFAAELNAGQLNALQHNPNVDYIEQDARVQATTTQSGATWGLDRIDQRALPLSTTYDYTPTGAGVNVYIVDTGILLGHTQFGGRAVSGYDAVDGGSADDCNGHGTHVAGTVGGSTYGVAKGVKLVGVRVLNCQGSGTSSGVIAGIDWVRLNRINPAVANMSLGGGYSSAQNTA